MDYELDPALSVARYIKQEPVNRQNHQDEDISFKLSPYKNRVPVAIAYQSSIGYKALNQV